MSFLAIRDRARDIHKVLTPVFERMPDDDDVNNEEGRAMEAVRQRYSKDRPRVMTALITLSPATAVYVLDDVVEGWNNETHSLTKIQKDLAAADEMFLEDNDWRVFLDPLNSGAPSLRIVRNSPDEQCGLYYTIPHTLDTEDCTIRSGDFEACSQLCAHFAMEIAANYHARKAEAAPIAADAVEYRSISDRYRKGAEEAMKAYEKWIAGTVSGVIFEWDTEPTDGRERILHPRSRF